MSRKTPKTSLQSGALTVGQVSNIIGAAPRTVASLIDSGKLPGWRLPGTKDRRVSYNSVMAFCRRYSIPLATDKPARMEILLVGLERKLVNDLLTCSEVQDGIWGFTTVEDTFEAGIRCGKDGYCCMIIKENRSAISSIANKVLTPGIVHGLRIIGIIPDDQSIIAPPGVEALFYEPASSEEIKRSLRSALKSSIVEEITEAS